MHIADQAQPHHVINIVQRIAHLGGQPRIAPTRGTPLACFGVHKIRAGRAGAKIHAVGHDLHAMLAVAPPQRKRARRGRDGVLDDVRRNTHA